MAGRHHECELYTGRLPEASESHQNWITCSKNPGHEKFIPVPDFIDKYLPRIWDVKQQEVLRAQIDATVRLRVRYTSLERPEDGDMTNHRGTHKLRVGTGWINYVYDPVYNEPCPCFECGGKVMRKHWQIEVRTARHVVFNTEEAEKTKVDLFYDDTDSDVDGRMKSAWGLGVLESLLDKDFCHMICVTCDEELVERLGNDCKFPFSRGRIPKENLYELGLEQSCPENCNPLMIISHPHGQPKQITLGELKYWDKSDLKQYTTPTCPGSSGAPVLGYCSTLYGFDGPQYYDTEIHSGCYGDSSKERYDRPSLPKRLFNKFKSVNKPTQQLNYGHGF